MRFYVNIWSEDSRATPQLRQRVLAFEELLEHVLEAAYEAGKQEGLSMSERKDGSHEWLREVDSEIGASEAVADEETLP